ncbi:glycosyltransferase [Vreelandella piezotolerans]|mgnify:CR=1 FL=1|uniref:Glycosyltransferase n=2 Tax=Vreelandella piezotolerans TaxID=2609667 RepID=A0ABQ6XB36_9GAMM|nr:glycosyltransferase [Halomonas piezotolerans]QJA26020.1 glycosyltransferase [Halomonas piezotolerans]
MIAVSIIVPCFNAYSKIGRCLASLRSIDFPSDDYEVIFVDDKSTDGTYEMLKAECETVKNWSVTQLQNNSGSPSKPRNEGVKLAKGKYVFYLDCDDEILADTIKVHYQHAEDCDACIVRGNLVVNDGANKKVMNEIGGWAPKLTKKQRVEKIISKQSTTVTQLIKRNLLQKHEIQWNESIKMGEDTIFLVDVLSKAENIEYLPHDTFIYNKMPSFVLSSTQAYGDKDLNDHINVWSYAQAKLKEVGVDYSKSRLFVGLSTSLKSLIHKNKNDIKNETFSRLSSFLKEHEAVINSYNLSERFKEIVVSALKEDFKEFKNLCRPRLLIAGHDLKFIIPAETALSEHFNIRYDKWESHTAHNEKRSKELLEWAEIIWCEWMLGNSLWYSKHKYNHQKLIFRVHRQELATSYADDIDFSKVDMVITVSALFFERLLERFPNIPRKKVRLISNYIDVDAYKKEWHPDRLFNLAMIGILPSRKNFHIGLELLKELRKKDKRYKFLVYSRRPKELAWLVRNRDEMAYFDKCEDYIESNKLSDFIEFKGHCDLKKSLADDRVGFVLSLSESMQELPGFESFHLAVADGFASGGVGLIKKWAGCEYIYHNSIMFDQLSEITDFIHEVSNNEEKFKALSSSGIGLLKKYSLESFVNSVKKDISII